MQYTNVNSGQGLLARSSVTVNSVKFVRIVCTCVKNQHKKELHLLNKGWTMYLLTKLTRVEQRVEDFYQLTTGGSMCFGSTCVLSFSSLSLLVNKSSLVLFNFSPVYYCRAAFEILCIYRYSALRAVLIAFICTFFEVFNIPVFWPILVMYFILLFIVTMKKQILVSI